MNWSVWELKITQECDYAIRIVLMLSGLGAGARVDANSIAQAQGVPQRFTVKILRKLVQGGIVCSFKGAKGGYCLQRPPEDITLKELVFLIDGPVEINKCLGGSYVCGRGRMPVCAVRRQLQRINSMICDELGKIDFASLREQETASQKNS